MLSFNPRTVGGRGTYLKYQSGPELQVLPASLSPYLYQGIAGIPTLYPELSRPWPSCPSPSGPCLCNSCILVTHPLWYTLCTFGSWLLYFLSLSPCGSGSWQLWGLPNVSAPGYALPHLFNKLSPSPYLEVMSFPFLPSFTLKMTQRVKELAAKASDTWNPHQVGRRGQTLSSHPWPPHKHMHFSFKNTWQESHKTMYKV